MSERPSPRLDSLPDDPIGSRALGSGTAPRIRGLESRHEQQIVHAQTPELLIEYLDQLQAWAGATGAGLLMHMEPAQRETLMLVGACQLIPEFKNLDAAWRLVSEQDNDQSVCGALQVVPSLDDEVLLVRMSFRGILARPVGQRRTINERRSNPDVDVAPQADGVLWIGLRGCRDVAMVVNRLRESALAPVVQNGGNPETPEVASSLTARLIWNVYHLTTALQDPVSRLPGRMEFQVFLKRALSAAQSARQPLSLLLLNPDDFSMINHRYGRAQGDTAISEIAHALMDCLRETDGVFRYGGAVFGAVLPATAMQECLAAAEKVRRRLTTQRYVDGNEQLTFSVGAVVANADDTCREDLKADKLLRLADTALNRARLSGGGRVIASGLSETIPAAVEAPPLRGIFTTDTEKDYRNMLLLWETVGMISGNTEPRELAAGFVDRLALAFQPDRIALFAPGEDGQFEVLATNVIDPAVSSGRASDRAVDLDPDQRALLDRSLESQQLEHLAGSSQPMVRACAVPLVAHGQVVGCLYMDGQGQRLALDGSDVSFLTALGGQLAVALDRTSLAARWIREKDRESRALREELAELRLSRDQGRMIFRSREMHCLMDTVKQVAPSNATVLITGESGTGKEMLAHALHELSDRAEGPFVVFDCGAVAHSLIEAELFGHVRGAFTGAERASPGRVQQAHGGTLFLDEIGELPLELQSKLLRFVQEKEIYPVGGGSSRTVDVRVVAATNRQLQEEVAAGRFRADLYYRLQVISLEAVPLRHRAADIALLAQHFLERFAAQHHVKLGFTDEAKALLLEHHWPGNVRELENCVLRAALTCGSDWIDAEDIQLTGDPAARREQLHDVERNETLSSSPTQVPFDSSDANGSSVASADPEVCTWSDLSDEFAEQIRLALEQNRQRPVPLGRWLNEDLVLAASELSGGVSRQAARILGIPESTYRRQFRKASAEAEAGIANRTPAWSAVAPLILQVVRSRDDDEDQMEQARQLLLERVLDQTESLMAGAALMGVSAPTFKRWIAASAPQQKVASC